MIIIGLTGPTGSGKSTVAALAEKKGFLVIDCDKVASVVTKHNKELLDKLCQAFGNDIINQQGELNRKLLAERAFSTADSTEKLNEISLPFIVSEISKMLLKAKKDNVKTVVLDAPTLYESGIDEVCDSVIAVLCPKNIRRERIITRDGLTPNEADVRLNASKPDEFYTMKTKHIIYNIGDFQSFRSTALEVLCKVVDNI